MHGSEEHRVSEGTDREEYSTAMTARQGPETSYTVVALDPGRTTGHATGFIEDGLMKIHSGQTAFNHLDLYNNLSIVQPEFIVCELFEFRTGTRSRGGLDLYPCELIGVVELFAQQHTLKDEKVVSCFFQKPSAALGGYWTDTKLKKDELYKATKGGHANDAVRHLLQWYTYGPGYKYNSSGYESGGK